MFGLGMGEILVIAIVALLFLGPEKLPGAAKSLSKGIRDLRKHTRDLQRTIEDDTQVGDAIRDLKSALRGDYMDPFTPPTEGDDGPEKADDRPKTHKASAQLPKSGDATTANAPPEQPAPADATAEPPAYTYGNDNDGKPLIRPAADTVASGEQLEPTPATGGDDGPKPADDTKAHG